MLYSFVSVAFLLTIGVLVCWFVPRSVSFVFGLSLVSRADDGELLQWF